MTVGVRVGETAFLDARWNDIPVSVRLPFGNQHFHAHHCGSLGLKTERKIVLTRPISIIEGEDNILQRIGRVP